jgi:hypothetical protein
MQFSLRRDAAYLPTYLPIRTYLATSLRGLRGQLNTMPYYAYKFVESCFE